MVLDTSGSMGTAADSLRKAAAVAVETPAENAQFAIISFNEKIELVLDFHSIDNKEPIERAIAQVKPRFTALGPVCTTPTAPSQSFKKRLQTGAP